MTRTALIAVGLLSLTLVVACAPDDQQRPTAVPAAGAEASSVASASAPTTAAEVAVTPPAAAAVPAAAATAAAAPTARTPAAPGAAAAPAPAPRRTAATTGTAPAPAPRRTAPTSPAASPTRAPAPSSQFALTIRDFAFSPRLLTIPAGSTVTATNQDEATHDWTSANGVWRSGDLPQGASYSFTFPTSGTFDYLCERHPQMTGTITVTPR